MEVPTPIKGSQTQKHEGEKPSRSRFPIIGDESVIPIRIMTFTGLLAFVVAGTIYITNLNNKVNDLTKTCDRIEGNFNDLITALGIQKYGAKGGQMGPTKAGGN